MELQSLVWWSTFSEHSV